MTWRLWWPQAAERRGPSYDAVWQYWGDLQFQIDAVRAGELPLWNPYDRAGYPAHADPQLALFYPVNWALVGLGLIAGPGWWLVALKTLIHLCWAALGAHAYLRRRGAPDSSGYLAGGTLVLTYPVSKTLWSLQNYGISWAPWMLVAVDAWAERPTRRRAAWLALATAMSLLSGSPPASWYALLVVVPYGLWAVAAHPRRALIGSGALAVGLFVAMTAAQLSATLSLLPSTVRAVRDLDFVGSGPYGPQDLFGMLAPQLPGEMAYLGVAVLLLALISLRARFEPRRLVLLGSAVAGVLLAFGSLAPYLPALASAPGPFDLFRFPNRYLYVTALPLAILAGEGLAELLALPDRAARARMARGAGVAGSVAALVFVSGWVMQARSSALRMPYLLGAVSALLGAAVVAGLAVAPDRLRPVIAGVATALILADLYVGVWPRRDLRWEPAPRTPRDVEAMALEGVPFETRIWDREFLKYRPGTRLHVRDLGGYQIDPLALKRYVSAVALAERTPRVLRLYGVGWLLESDHKPLPRHRRDAAVFGSHGGGVSRVVGAVPTVLWVDAARIVEDADQAFKALPELAPAEVVVERHGLSVDATARVSRKEGGAPGAGRIVDFGLNRLAAEVDAPADGLVVVHEMFHPGWSATVDGAAAPILTANGLFRAVLVGPGHHRIEMQYRAPGWVALAGLALVAMGATALLAQRPSRQSASSAGA
jgi:hypothetical protein